MSPRTRRRRSSSPAGPRRARPTQACSPRSRSCERVVALGHQARSAAGLKLRQPLRRIVVEGAPLAAAHADEIAEELRVKEVEFGHVDAELRVKPHLPALGPKLGKELGAVRAALQAGEFEELGDGRFRAAGHELGAGRGARRAGRQGRLGGRRRRRRHGRARHRGRRRARARGPRLRADPPGQLDAQGRRARAHRPHRADAARVPTPTCSSTPTGSHARRSPVVGRGRDASTASRRSSKV